ncbi:hypothetical protein Hanom_Chr14g01324591 [Helianthus anomalus]
MVPIRFQLKLDQRLEPIQVPVTEFALAIKRVGNGARDLHGGSGMEFCLSDDLAASTIT